jgi:uncharacterized coiled-coil protein SlyX
MPANPTQPLETRVGETEAAIEALRTAIAGLEREIGLLRADLERLRVESERAVGAKLP